MNFKLLYVMVAVVLSLAAVAATPADKAAEKARNDKFKALTQECDALVKKDFKGRFANYWHDSIDAARAKYEAALNDADFSVAQKVDLHCRIAQCRLEATRDVEGAMKDFDAAIALAGSDEKAKSKALAAKERIAAMVDGSYFPAHPVVKGGERPGIVKDKIEELFKAGGLEKVRAELLPFVAAEQEKADSGPKQKNKPSYYRDAWTYFTHWRRRSEKTGLMRQRGAKEFVVQFAESAPDGQKPNAAALFELTEGVPSLTEKRIGYAKETLALAEDPKNRISAKTVDAARFFLSYSAAKGNPEKMISALASTNKVEWAERLGQAAQRLLREGNETAARIVWQRREELAPTPEQPVLDVPYWEGPHDIRGIVESDFYRQAKKGLLNRKYGDNLEFLILTDSAILGREMTTDNGEKFRPTELFAFWDRYGVKILLRNFADNMDDVKAGLANPVSYEAYLSTGIDDPYHTMMISAKEGAETGDGFVTQYDNVTGYRQLTRKEGSLSVENLYFDDGVATLITIPWCATFAAVPWKHPDWFFEPLEWSHGGVSWGGSKSVHQRSTFGRLHFTGCDARSAAAVRRTLLPVAKAKLAAACNARSAGTVEFWSDPVLGDQAFYLAEVKPLVDRLQPMMDLVGKGLTDADAVKAWDAAGEDAMNIDYLVSLKRTQWLKRKQLSE